MVQYPDTGNGVLLDDQIGPVTADPYSLAGAFRFQLFSDCRWCEDNEKGRLLAFVFSGRTLKVLTQLSP